MQFLYRVHLYLYEFGFTKQEDCRFFKEKSENSLHILCRYSAFVCKRHRSWDCMFFEPKILKGKGMSSLINLHKHWAETNLTSKTSRKSQKNFSDVGDVRECLVSSVSCITITINKVFWNFHIFYKHILIFIFILFYYFWIY